jgi:Secretion system C-terminal sorting domain
MKLFFLLPFLLMLGLNLAAQSNSKTDLTVYPNPVTEFISINDSKDAVAHIVVFSLVGKKEREFECTTKGEQYQISDLPKGLYLVQLQDRDRKVLTTQKIQKR